MKKWFVFYVQFNHEKKIHMKLKAAGYESYLPLLSKVKKWSDRIKKVDVPMFPSYSFVNCLEKDIHKIICFEGIVKAIKIGEKYAIVTNEEIEKIKFIERKPDEIEIYSENLEKGRKVEILSGYFKGYIGELIGIKSEKKSMVILIDFLGTKVVTHLNSVTLKKI